MADELKRVGLSFKADGSVDFQKTLKEVNASVQENRSAFKLAQSQWDSSTKSVDKLKDRQKYLAEQTKDYSDKVKILERQLEELERAEKRDEKAIQSKRNQLNTAKTSLNHYKKGLDEVNKELRSGSAQIEEYAKKIDSLGKKSSEFGKTLTKRVTAPIVAVGGLAIKSAMELDEGYDTIITKTGATGDALQELNDVADSVFGSMPVEMAEVGTAVGEVNTRFGLTGTALEKLSREFLKFAEINGVDLNNSIGTVDKIMTQFGIDSSKTAEVLGILTKRSQETGISTDILMNSVSANSATFQSLGFSLESSVNLLAQFEQNGVNSQTAMTGLQKAVVNMAKDGKSADEALLSIIDSIKNATTETEAINQATQIFGTKGAVQMVNAIRSGRFDLDQLKDSMEKYGDVVNSTWEETQDPWDKLKTAMNEVKIAGSDLAGELLDTLSPIIEGLCEKIKEATEWFKGLDDSTKEMIAKIGLAAAAIGPMLMILGTMISTVGHVVHGLGGLVSMFAGTAGAAGATGGAFAALTGPIGIVVGAIAAIVAAFVALYNTNDEFRQKVNEVWLQIKDKIQGVVDSIKDLISAFVGVIKAIWKEWGDEITQVATYAFQYISDFIGGALDIIQNIIKTVTALLKGDWDGVWNGIKDTIESVWNAISTLISDKINAVKYIIQVVVDFIKEKWSQAWNAVKDKVVQIWDSIKSAVSGAINRVKDCISSGLNAAKDTVGRVLGSIRDKFSSIFERAKEIARSAIDKIRGFFNFKWSLPKIKLPKFNITGKFSLAPPKVPKFSISWHAKGGILNKPTIFGKNGDSFMGGGEAGKEAILPIRLLKDYIREENQANNGILVRAIKEAIAELNLVAENHIYIGDRKIADVLTDLVVKKINAQTNQLRMVQGR